MFSKANLNSSEQQRKNLYINLQLFPTGKIKTISLKDTVYCISSLRDFCTLI